jgi:hypothetical protein
MSHFSVLVVANNDQELEDKLMPYHEYECTGIDQYCQWVDDIHDEHLKEYNEETVECVLKNGKIIGTKYSDNEIIKSMWKRNGIGFSSKDEFIIAEGYDLVDVPFKEKYSTFDEFMNDWCGYSKKNPATGRFERWTNPNAKWDWYEVGGRYSNRLINKNGNKSDFAYVEDIDWDTMILEKKNFLLKNYDDFYSYYNQENVIPTVDEITKYEEWASRYDKVKTVILDSTQYAKISRAFDAMDWYMWGLDEIEKFLTCNREEYSVVPALTYAFVGLDGKWNQEAEMGWWGMDDKSKGTECYDGEWWQLVQNLPAGSGIYIVDCHI